MRDLTKREMGLLSILIGFIVGFMVAHTLTGCGDNGMPPTPDAPWPGFQSCSDPYTEGGPCPEVCCEGEDWWDNPSGGFWCMNTHRRCVPPGLQDGGMP